MVARIGEWSGPLEIPPFETEALVRQICIDADSQMVIPRA
jgi:hypothetical protein